MKGRHFLFVPGPTHLPESIARAMQVPMEDHRAAIFPDLVLPLLDGLRTVFGTRAGRPFIFPATGTGGWEAALTNTLSPGDRVLAVRNGQFSTLWIQMAERLGLDVRVIDVEWGATASPAQIAAFLRADLERKIRGVLVVHNETSTGVTTSVAQVRRVIDETGHPALLYVDAISSLGSVDFRMDEWGVDLVIAGSQKGMMLPAGLALVCASPKALSRGAEAQCRRVFFDFADMLRENTRGYFPYTPALPLLYGLKESIRLLTAEGLPQVAARHERLAAGTRAAVAAWGLSVCARDPQTYSNSVTAIYVPHGFSGIDVVRLAHERYHLSLGAGLGSLAGKAFRIGHLGDVNELMLLGAFAGVEMTLRDLGVPLILGSGVAAAQEYWLRNRRAEAAAPPARVAEGSGR